MVIIIYMLLWIEPWDSRPFSRTISIDQSRVERRRLVRAHCKMENSVSVQIGFDWIIPIVKRFPFKILVEWLDKKLPVYYQRTLLRLENWWEEGTPNAVDCEEEPYTELDRNIPARLLISEIGDRWKQHIMPPISDLENPNACWLNGPQRTTLACVDASAHRNPFSL